MNTLKVLVIEEDEHDIGLIRTIVESENYSCLVAYNESEALAFVRNEQPNLILNNPSVDGFEFARNIKSDPELRHIPIIMIASMKYQNSRIKGLISGAEEYLIKPVDPTELVLRMRNLLRLKEYNDYLTNYNQRLEEEVEKRTRELSETRLEIIQILGKTAEYRDNESSMHVVRISNYSRLLAESLQLKNDFVQRLYHASALHDVGKVGIPDSIVLKPGELSEGEWEVMKMHTTIGARILTSKYHTEVLDMARRIALSHHEKWDGSGYPNNLKGERIPLEARIVALADVFYALTSKRPYKNAWPVDQALKEIEQQKGVHFDQKLADLFILLQPQLEQVIEIYPDAE